MPKYMSTCVTDPSPFLWKGHEDPFTQQVEEMCIRDFNEIEGTDGHDNDAVGISCFGHPALKFQQMTDFAHVRRKAVEEVGAGLCESSKTKKEYLPYLMDLINGCPHGPAAKVTSEVAMKKLRKKW